MTATVTKTETFLRPLITVIVEVTNNSTTRMMASIKPGTIGRSEIFKCLIAESPVSLIGLFVSTVTTRTSRSLLPTSMVVAPTTEVTETVREAERDKIGQKGKTDRIGWMIGKAEAKSMNRTLETDSKGGRMKTKTSAMEAV